MDNISSFSRIFESSPRIPKLNHKGLKYWKSKGKYGKDVMIYTHDDMDGIYSAVVVKEYLIKMGYNIKGYGVLNYMDSWKNTELDPKMINVAVDFANMPEPKREGLIDVYIDHHGQYSEEEKENFKSQGVLKTQTGSAYEGICLVLGLPTDELVLYSIDMIDSAKYEDYGVDWRDILDFNWDRFTEIANKKGTITVKPFKRSKEVTYGYGTVAKLTFAGAFNQLLKRSDHKTMIEVIDNVKDLSIYNIYNVMKRIYPGNNVWAFGRNKGEEKDFIEDGKWRVNTMKSKTRGNIKYKKVYTDQREFFEETQGRTDGYKIIGNLAYFPSGLWVNALRARAIIMQDYDNGDIDPNHRIDFILLQYGNTIQICSYEKISNMPENILPKTKEGDFIKDLGVYMASILDNFRKYFGYYDPDTSIGQEEVTVTGGHVGIGTISNIIGKVGEDVSKVSEPYVGYRFLDLIKNKIINDLSGIKWNLKFQWPKSDDDDPKLSMIKDIIRNIEPYKSEVDDYVKDQMNSGNPLSPKDIRSEKTQEITDKLMDLDKDELEEIINNYNMNKRVVMKGDIRQLNNKGEIKENKVVRFKNFK